MSFSRAQQGKFQPLVARAWTKAATAEQWNPKDAVRKREWYEEQLDIAVGKRSTTECDNRRDFESVMAHFETLVGDSIYWTHRVHGADKRRIIFLLRELCADADVEEFYMREIARKVLRRILPPSLDSLSYDELTQIMIRLKIQLHRQLRRGQDADRPRRMDEADANEETGLIDRSNVPF